MSTLLKLLLVFSMAPVIEYPFPADHFKINNKKDNPNRFILFLTQYSGKQTRFN